MRKVAILANGDFPRLRTAARTVLKESEIIVACDGAAATLWRKMRRRADYVIGDFDSLSPAARRGLSVRVDTLVHEADQDTNDLTKAINFCRRQGWRNLVIVGATGKREDHTLGNIFRAMESGVKILTDEGVFLPFAAEAQKWRLSLKHLGKGVPISIFATDRNTQMVSVGLEWPLDNLKFENLYCATLNRTISAELDIVSSRPAFVFIAKKNWTKI